MKKLLGNSIVFTISNVLLQAITFLLLKWCKLESVQENRVLKYSFKGNVIFNKRLNSPDVFKLTINDKNEVVNVENIEFDDLEFDDFNKGETCKK